MNCVESSDKIFTQLNSILSQLNNSQYGEALSILNGSSIGKHVRHIIEFYQCIIESIPGGNLDYSKRLRNGDIETNTALASSIIDKCLSSMHLLQAQQPLLVIPDFDPDNMHGKEIAVSSSVGREIMYAYDHAIHHLAIIKIGIKESFPKIEISDSLGVAPSTLRYENSLKV